MTQRDPEPVRDGSHNIGKMAELGDGSVLITGHRRKDGGDQYRVIDPYRFHRPSRGELWLDAVELTNIMGIETAIEADDTHGHTPEPWTVVREEYHPDSYEVLNEKKTIAFGINSKVDADLIAAAPTMLKALRSVDGRLEDLAYWCIDDDSTVKVIEGIREAITLATKGADNGD